MANRSTRFQVEFVATGDGQIRAQIQNVTKDVVDSGRQAKEAGSEWEAAGRRIGTAIGAIGAAAIGGLLLLVKNTRDASQELPQLDAVLRSTGNAAGMTRDQLVRLAETLSDKSTFSTGEIVNAETRLLSYSGIVGTNIPRAMQTVIDQSARLGISLSQSAETIGRALESPQKAAAALAQQGFGAAFTPAVRQQIKELDNAGKAAEAQAVIMGILEESYEGAAEAARGSLDGALKALGNTITDLLTGDTEGEGVRGLTTAVNELTDTLGSSETKQAFDSFGSWVLGITTELVQGISMLTNWIAKVAEARGLAAGGDVSQSSEDGLNVRLGVVAQQRRSLEGWTSNAFGLPLTNAQSQFRGEEIARLAQEQQDLQREITRRLVAQNFQGVTSTVSSTAGSALTGDVKVDPEAAREAAKQAREAEQAATRIARATERVQAVQASWTTELQSTGNPVLDEYARRLDSIRSQAVALERAGLPSAAVDEFTASLRQLAEQIRDRELAEFQQEFTAETDAMAASLAGPAVQAAIAYTQALAKVQEQLDAGAITQQQYADRERQLAATRDQAATEMIRQIEEERAALGMTAEDYEVYINLKQAGVDANSELGESIVSLTRRLQDERESAGFFTDIRDATTSMLVDAGSNLGSLGDVVEDFADRIRRVALQLFAEKAVQWLFGSLFGGTGATAYTGTSASAGSTLGFGNNVSGLTGSNWLSYGGGRATGGSVDGSRIYEVNEQGAPELLRVGSRTFLMPGADGVVMPASSAAAGGAGGATAPTVILNMRDADGGTLQGEVTSQRWDGNALNLDLMVSQSIARDAASNGAGIRTQQRVLGLRRQGVKLG
ncbi:phage tail length tape measure family protein [Stenotrophomonas sp. MMGLT7]|uniref:phage tail length tape measure family protein n=1 Tax=Stenotrophomonas sp. MMGLT7 TaxID=2901227 RepID=UPI001E55588B|nr:phage tail length tape measure family protein [Stenotrophomonas sp. MMGLT7]